MQQAAPIRDVLPRCAGRVPRKQLTNVKLMYIVRLSTKVQNHAAYNSNNVDSIELLSMASP